MAVFFSKNSTILVHGLLLEMITLLLRQTFSCAQCFAVFRASLLGDQSFHILRSWNLEIKSHFAEGGAQICKQVRYRRSRSASRAFPDLTLEIFLAHPFLDFGANHFPWGLLLIFCFTNNLVNDNIFLMAIITKFAM